MFLLSFPLPRIKKLTKKLTTAPFYISLKYQFVISHHRSKIKTTEMKINNTKQIKRLKFKLDLINKVFEACLL